MGGHFEADTPDWTWQRDESGASIEADLVDAARRIWARALAYARHSILHTEVTVLDAA